MGGMELVAGNWRTAAAAATDTTTDTAAAATAAAVTSCRHRAHGIVVKVTLDDGGHGTASLTASGRPDDSATIAGRTLVEHVDIGRQQQQ